MSITPNNDYKDVLRALNDAGADYLVVGAHAVAAHGFARFTQDFDVFVRPTPENAARVYRALMEFGAPMSDVQPGVDFDSAWDNRRSSSYDDEPMNIISRDDLLINKRASGRAKDLEDVKNLEKLGRID